MGDTERQSYYPDPADTLQVQEPTRTAFEREVDYARAKLEGTKFYVDTVYGNGFCVRDRRCKSRHIHAQTGSIKAIIDTLVATLPRPYGANATKVVPFDSSGNQIHVVYAEYKYGIGPYSDEKRRLLRDEIKEADIDIRNYPPTEQNINYRRYQAEKIREISRLLGAEWRPNQVVEARLDFLAFKRKDLSHPQFCVVMSDHTTGRLVYMNATHYEDLMVGAPGCHAVGTGILNTEPGMRSMGLHGYWTWAKRGGGWCIYSCLPDGSIDWFKLRPKLEERQRRQM